MKLLQSSLIGIAAFGLSSSAHATVTFYSDFTEASLGAITGLNIDTPTESGANNSNDGSGTVVLNAGADTLDITAMDANMWGTRDGAPIAWVARPTVVVGQTWYAQTQLTLADSPDANTAANRPGFDQAGITFYSGTAGANPGSENPDTGTVADRESLFVGINDWGAYHHAIQGLADNNPNSGTTGVAATAADGTFEYRVEITENGATDDYNFFYREASADPWTQIGATDTPGRFFNDAVGLWVKTHNDNAGVTVPFDYFEVGIVPEPSTGILAALAGLSLALRRRRK